MANENQSPKVYDGDDIIVQIGDKTTLHATSHSLKVDMEVKERRTKTTRGKCKKPGDITWSIDAEALVVVKDQADAGGMDSFDTLDAMLKKEELSVTFLSNYGSNGTPVKYTGKAFATSFSESAASGEDATYTLTLTGSGDLTKVAEAPAGE